MLLTRPPLPRVAERAFDLHVLGTPPAFILSQDQTRHSLLRVHSVEYTLDVERSRQTLRLAVSLELTETASASISVFHSSIVKVPAQHDLHAAIS